MNDCSNNNSAELLAKRKRFFIAGNGDKETFEKLLADTLSIAKSQFGFIAETLHSDLKVPYLNMLAMTNIAW